MSSLVLIVGVVLAPLISTVISSLLLLWWDRVVEFKLFVDELQLQYKLTEYLEINFEKNKHGTICSQNERMKECFEEKKLLSSSHAKIVYCLTWHF